MDARKRTMAYLGMLFILAACNQMSEHYTDKSAGLNGGFEIAKNGLPVNWLMYTPRTVPDADFEIILDRLVYKEGEQSLKFTVSACSSKGGWHSPGFTNEFFDIGRYPGPARYKLRFWIKNEGALFRISAGGVSEKSADMRVLIEDDREIPDWKPYEFTIEVPQDEWLRLQLNLLQPGTFWIDGVEIEKF